MRSCLLYASRLNWQTTIACLSPRPHNINYRTLFKDHMHCTKANHGFHLIRSRSFAFSCYIIFVRLDEMTQFLHCNCFDRHTQPHSHQTSFFFLHRPSITLINSALFRCASVRLVLCDHTPHQPFSPNNNWNRIRRNFSLGPNASISIHLPPGTQYTYTNPILITITHCNQTEFAKIYSHLATLNWLKTHSSSTENYANYYSNCKYTPWMFL